MSEVLLPAQIVGALAVAVTVGEGFTVITRVAVPVQPAVVPVTVYVVVIAGETVTEVPVNDPGIQLYVVAPLAVIVVELPEQIVVLVAVVVTVGLGVTLTVTVCVLVQPLTAVPVTVYVVVPAGLTVTGDPVSDPGIHAYVDAPPPVSVVLLPAQIVELPALAVTVGVVFTVTVRVPVVVQPFAAVAVTVYVVVVAGETDTGVPLREPGIHA